MAGGKRVTLRLDDETSRAIEEYQRKLGSKRSQAMRTLLALALREESESADLAFRRASFHEGLVEGVLVARKRLREAIDKAIDDINVAVEDAE